mgnify:CR=1 FL=1
MVEPVLLPYLEKVQDGTFQQNNAGSHVSRVAMNFLADNNDNILPWRPRSPDLNPTEHVWDML